MRIISGAKRGKSIKAPTSLPVRPTTDMAKESLFNMINNYFSIPHINALDLFSGTGNLSYELASRGCQEVLAIDKHPGCAKFIRTTAQELAFSGIQVLREDALRYVKSAYLQFDLIIADPPYDYEHYEELVAAILDRKLLKDNGVFVLEFGQDQDFSAHPHCFDVRKYGSVHFAFFADKEVETEEE
ncbi:MAG: RsmD family RNA methyltransferase [Schleiferiaceae bacterium]|nr:RsmD family RNA methyltransferase [Schleiferiaceae bacterium]